MQALPFNSGNEIFRWLFKKILNNRIYEHFKVYFEWYHAACSGIEAADLPILKKYESVHWYCKICNTRASQLLPKKFTDAVDNISRKQDANETARMEDYQQLKEIKESLQQMNSTINEFWEKNQPVYANYADAVKNVQINTVEKPTDSPTKRIECDLTKILIVSNSKKLTNSIEMKREFAKFFPLKQLLYAFNTARGNIHLEFHSSQQADNVFSSWHEKILGTNTSVRKPSPIHQSGERCPLGNCRKNNH